MAFFFELVGFIIILIFAFVPGLIEKPCPKGYVFDMVKSATDLASGISKWEYLRRKNCGDYWITQEEYNERIHPKEVIPGVVDIDRYNFEKTQLDESSMWYRVNTGCYKNIVKDKSKWIDLGK